MSTVEEIEALTNLARIILREPPTDPELATRYATWLKQITVQLRRAASRLDDQTP